MKKYFTIIVCGEEAINIVKDVLLDLIGPSSSGEIIDSNTLLVAHDYSNSLEIESAILGLTDELMTDIICYNSSPFNKNINVEKRIALHLLKELPAGAYSLKSAIALANRIENKNQILEYILDGSGITPEFIKKFVNYDLNVSKAAKAMYIHRNTMLYKLDKLKELSGFDLRSFKDAYILYYLCEKR